MTALEDNSSITGAAEPQHTPKDKSFIRMVGESAVSVVTTKRGRRKLGTAAVVTTVIEGVGLAATPLFPPAPFIAHGTAFIVDAAIVHEKNPRSGRKKRV